MKWLYANPIVLNLIISIIALLILFVTPLTVVLIVKALFDVDSGTLGFVGSIAFLASFFTSAVWGVYSWRYDGND